MTHDLIVLGAGPAGANAAMAAAQVGLKVVLLDEQDGAGGQVWRQPLPGLTVLPVSAEARSGDALRAEISASSVDLRLSRRIWSVGGRFRVDALGPQGNETVEAPSLIAATGAHERVVPFPGWTLPGVIGLAAATVLIKSQGVTPGQKVVVAGCGPLLVAVAAGILKLGGEVAGIIDLAGRRDWLAALPSLATQPRLLGRGLGWAAKIGAARVPVYFGHAVKAAQGEHALERIVIAPVGRDGAYASGPEITFEADALCIGHGLVPGAEVTKLLRAEHRFDRLRGGFVPVLDAYGRTTVERLFACGDGAGLRGAIIAEQAGRLAGLAAAHDAGAVPADRFAQIADPILAAISRGRPFSDAMAGIMALRPAQVAAIAPETVICRCEDVTRGEIDAAHEAGAHDLNQLKHFTRCGMGPCQGRMCGDVTAELLAGKLGSREQAGYWTGRPPLRPVPLDALMGAFDYSDIPIPEPAPL
ncbi:NAD(P)/FAD-dependent oxidoreductase [Bosea sp. 685]|uniref:NAD(P)/FAD-dependent oxidoreductase n=1 Tax=Bosea sp. 685 TaxID=3080057 RepID=UPI002892B3F1|nr:NAD(P)/FAD-dependent oxidoreductase [Bosea sp. 685]WNJ91797.1 NAD(P)/FAD-dependent oxidoreductase [Bosea sp. 685]